MVENWAMIIYLLILQTIAIAAFLGPRSRQEFVVNDVIAVQVIILVGFHLVWSGYSTDAWRYLTGFDRTPLAEKKEWLFWMMGHTLQKIASDPWPLKILSATGVMLEIAAIFAFFGRKQRRDIVIALFVLALLPAFFISFGNAVRQGLAAAIIIYAMARCLDGKIWWFLLATLIAWLIHQPSLFLSMAILAGTYLSRNWIRFCLLLAPVFGILIPEVATWAGIDVDSYVKYSDRDEGVFHWAKFIFAYPLAWWMLYIVRDKFEHRFIVLKAYACMTALSSLLVQFEVPFERLLIFSELLLPLIVPLVVAHLKIQDSRIRIIWVIAMLAGILLWTHNSLRSTLGFI